MAKYVVEGEERYKCLSCEAFVEEPEDDPIYCCPECGNNFLRSDTENENHRSPCCGKFSSKVADRSCPECHEGEEGFEKMQVIECPKCGEQIEAGEIGSPIAE